MPGGSASTLDLTGPEDPRQLESNG
ncbi:hypothetical protein PSHT_05838 [Puccinia striiformis]|uniref:Uncharacterized protein n=2 Tax=Puccinia striiformis TaxID=27350 RepID=A0A2S4W9H6_9BASI|nr:hypothetical protein PSTT_01266 [Puccinia striiformis]POW18425.1 hypothetical protein PSHT_05838 [Puccinia striiformis]